MSRRSRTAAPPPVPAELAEAVAAEDEAAVSYLYLGWNTAHATPVKGARILAHTRELLERTARGERVVEHAEQTDLRGAIARMTAGADWPTSAARIARDRAKALGLAHGLATAGKCQRCGVPLKNPTSVARRVGPDCWAKGYRAADVEWADPEAVPTGHAARLTTRYADLEAFYAAAGDADLAELRQRSREVDYGCHWRLKPHHGPGLRGRLTWLEATGELIVVGPYNGDVEVVAVVGAEGTVERLLEDWAVGGTRDIAWALERLAGFPVVGPFVDSRRQAAGDVHRARLAAARARAGAEPVAAVTRPCR